MNINLIYKTNSFNFDLRKNISIKYIEDLASKLINKDKLLFELLYKGKIISESKNSLLKDIITKDDPNISIIISEKLPLKKELPQLKIFNNLNKTDNNAKNNLFLNDTDISKSLSENSIKIFQNLSKQDFKNKKIKNENSIQNKVFEEIYNAKDNEIFSLMKTFSQKIKEYDDILYKKYKNSFNKNNNELITYEKNIIDFKDKQIQFIKKLINFFDLKEKKDLYFGGIELDEFYKELNLYYNKDYIIKSKKKNEKLELKSLSPIKSYEKTITIDNNEFPLLMDNNKKFLSEKKIESNKKVNKTEENKVKFIYYTENKKNAIKQNNKKNIKDHIYQNIIIQKKNENN